MHTNSMYILTDRYDVLKRRFVIIKLLLMIKKLNLLLPMAFFSLNWSFIEYCRINVFGLFLIRRTMQNIQCKKVCGFYVDAFQLERESETSELRQQIKDFRKYTAELGIQAVCQVRSQICINCAISDKCRP